MSVSWRRRLLSSLLIPFAVLVILPLVILFLTNSLNGGWAKDPPQSVIVSFLGLVLVFCGLVLLIATVHLFSQQVYKQNAPRWIPRLTPWDSEGRGA